MPRSHRRWGCSLLAAAAGLGFGSLLAVGGVLAHPTSCTWLARRGIDLVAASLPGARIQVDRVQAGLARGMELHGARLLSLEGKELLGFDTLEVDWRPTSLLRWEVHLSSVRLVHPRAAIRVLDDGQLDLLEALGIPPSDDEDRPPSAPWQGLPIDLRVDSLELVGGEFSYSAGDQRFTLQDLDLQLRGGAEGRVAWTNHMLGSTTFSQWAGDEQRSLQVALAGGIALRDGDLEIEALQVQVQGVPLWLDGRVDRLEVAPDFNVHLKLTDLQPAEFQPWVGDTGVSGPLGLDLRLRGPMQSMLLTASLSTPGGTLALGAGANLLMEPPTWTADLRLAGFHLEKVLQSVSEPTHLSGGVTAEGEGFTFPDDLWISSTVELEPSQIWGQSVDKLHGELALDKGILRVGKVAFQSPLGRGWVTGSSDLDSLETGLEFRVKEIELPSLARFGVANVLGELNASGGIVLRHTARGLNIDLRADMDGRGLGYADIVESGIGSGPVHLQVLPTGEVTVEGQLTASNLRGYGVQLQSLSGPWFVGVQPDGEVLFQVQAQSTGASYPPASFNGLDVNVDGRVAANGDLTLDTGFRGRGILLEGIRADVLEGSTRIRDDKLALVVDARTEDRQVLGIDLDYDLSSGQVIAHRLLLTPSGQVHWEAPRDSRFQLTDGGLQALDLALVSDPEVRDPARLWVRGGLDFDGPVDLHVEIWDVTLDPMVSLIPMLPQGLSGRTRLLLDVGGSMDALRLQGEASVRDFRLPGTVSNLDMDLRVAGDEQGVDLVVIVPETSDEPYRSKSPPPWIKPLYAHATAHLPVDLSLTDPRLDLDAPWSLDLILGPGDLHRWERILDGQRLPDAALSGRVRVGGTPRHTTVQLRGAAEVPLGEGGALARLDLNLSQEGETLRMDSVLSESMGRRASVGGQCDTHLAQVVASYLEEFGLDGGSPPPRPALDITDPRTWAHELEVNLVPQGVDISTLRGLVDLPKALHGSLVGGIQLTGDPLRPRITGGLQLAEAHVGDVEVSPAMLTFYPEEGGYQVDLTMGFGEEGGLQVGGYFPVDLDLESEDGTDTLLTREGLHLQVGGDGVPLRMLASLFSDLTFARGLLKLQGSIEGSLSHPRPDLSIHLSDGGLGLETLSVRYDDVQVSGQMDGNQVRLDRLTATTLPLERSGPGIQPGTFSASGSVLLEDWAPAHVDLDATASNMWVSDTNLLRLVLDGDIQAVGDWPQITVSGDVGLNDARIVADQAVWLYSGTLVLDPAISIIREAEPVNQKATQDGPAFYDDFLVDLDVDLGRSTWVLVRMPLDDRFGAFYANLATMEVETQLDGKLAVGMANGELELRGEVETVRGRAEILGAGFELDEGQVTFAGGDPYDPILNLTAVHRTSQYGDVEVVIGGSVSTLDLSFRSEDYPDETDVASILLFGSPLSELSSSETETNNQLLALAAGALMGELERSLGGSVADLFQIDTTASGGIGAIRVGYAIGDNLFLILEYLPEADTISGENQKQAKVEWTISRHWLVEVVTGDQGAGSADLFRTWRF